MATKTFRSQIHIGSRYSVYEEEMPMRDQKQNEINANINENATQKAKKKKSRLNYPFSRKYFSISFN